SSVYGRSEWRARSTDRQISWSDSSSSIRSSCFCRRWVSPDSRVPRSNGRPRSLVNRSRRCRSSSAAIAEESQSAAEEGPQLAPGQDRVEVAEAKVRLGETEVVGQLLARRLLDDARAREREQRFRLGDDDVAKAREARQDTRRRGMGHDADEAA